MIDLRGKGIECLSLEHGQRIKKFFEDNGIDCLGVQFTNHLGDLNICRYYCVSSSNDCYCSSYSRKIELIELPKEDVKEELKFPRMMLCWDDFEEDAKELLVCADINNVKEYVGKFPIVAINSNGFIDGYRNAKEIPPKKKMTLAEIEAALGYKIEIIN